MGRILQRRFGRRDAEHSKNIGKCTQLMEDTKINKHREDGSLTVMVVGKLWIAYCQHILQWSTPSCNRKNTIKNDRTKHHHVVWGGKKKKRYDIIRLIYCQVRILMEGTIIVLLWMPHPLFLSSIMKIKGTIADHLSISNDGGTLRAKTGEVNIWIFRRQGQWWTFSPS